MCSNAVALPRAVVALYPDLSHAEYVWADKGRSCAA
jgi:hypothetical protein